MPTTETSLDTSSQIAHPAPKRGCAPWLVTLLIILVGAGALALFIKTRMQPPAANVSERSWQTEFLPIELVNTRPTITLFGTVEAPQLITERTAYPADIAAVPAREGSRFAAGDVLVELDDTELQLTLFQRRTDLDLLQVRHTSNLAALAEEKRLLDLTKRELERQQTLSRRGAISGAQLEQTRSSVGRQQLQVAQRQLAVDEFEARRQQALAALKQAELDVQRATITAPFAGIVASVNVAPGDRLQPGQPIISYYQPSELEIRATIPDQRLTTIQNAKLPLAATAEFANRNLNLQLVRLAGLTADRSSGMEGFFKPTTQAKSLVPGQVLTIQLNLPTENRVAIIPPDALYELDRIYVAIPADKFAAEQAHLTKKASASETEITSETASETKPQKMGEGYYRLKAVPVEVIGERRTINPTTGKANTQMLIKSKQLTPGDLAVITQLPNAVTGLLVTRLATNPTAE